jgi:16S rRNA (uracil1498-N3)-methyltransferase
VPQIGELVSLTRLLAAWPKDRRILWADEGLSGTPANALPAATGAPWAILIGPEGGFAPEERKTIGSMAGVTALALGPRILRADTAAVAAITLWQAAMGDWR